MNITRTLALFILFTLVVLGATAISPVVLADESTTEYQTNENLEKVSDDLLDQSGEINVRIALDGESSDNDKIQDVEQHVRDVDNAEHIRSFEESDSIAASVDADTINWSALADHSSIETIHKEELATIPDPPEDDSDLAEPEFFPDVQYGIEQTQTDKAWDNFETEGDDIKIAIIDNGVDPNHPSIELGGDPDDNYKGYWAVFNTTTYYDSSIDNEGPDAPEPGSSATYDHGTHVSGTATGGDETGTQIGVAPNATLMVANPFTDGVGAYTSDTTDAIEWAIDNDADVISLSLGSNFDPDEQVISSQIARTEAIQEARNQGIVVIASAGNDGDGQVSLPAADGESKAIGATDNSGDITGFSGGLEYSVTDDNWGSNEVANDWEDELIIPDFAAPGNRIYSARADSGSITQSSGTSMAAPHVAGSSALLLENNPDLTPDEVYTAFEETTLEAPDEQDTRYGHGIINTNKAIKVSKEGGYVNTVDLTANETVLTGDTLLIEAKHKNKNIFDEDATRDITLYINGTSVGQDQLTLNPEQKDNTTIEYTVKDKDVGEEDIILSTGDENRTVETDLQQPAELEPTILEDQVDDPLLTETEYAIPVEVENVGGTTGVGDLDLFINETKEVDGDLNIPELEPGETEVVELNYTTTPDDKPELNITAKTDDGQNELDREVVDPAAFEPSINTTNLENGIIPEEETTFEVDIENIGGIEGDTDTELYINESLEQSTESPIVQPGETETVAFDYTPSEDDTPELNFTVKTTPGEATEETVDVLKLAESELTITNTNSPIESDDLEATIEVENIGETDLDQTLEINVPEIGSNTTTVSVDPESSTPQTVTIPTEQGDNGDYTLTASTPDDSTTEEVNIGQVGTFEVAITDISDPVKIGENLTVDAELTNVGDEQTTQEIVSTDNITESPFNTTSVELDPSETETISVERKTTLDDMSGVEVTINTDDDQATETLSLEPPEPPEITSLTVDEDRTNDEATVTVTFDQGGVNITEVETGVEANFTSFSETQLNQSDVSSGGVWETTFSVDSLPSDGNYTATATIEDEVGQTENGIGHSFEVDTEAPSVQLGIDELGTSSDAELSIAADEDFEITSLEINDSDGTDIAPSPPTGLQTDTVTKQFDDDDSSEFDITVEAEDELGNSVTETMSASVSDYEVQNANAEVTPSGEYAQFDLNANESEVNDGEERESISTTSNSLPDGTTATESQIISGVVDVSDIGLDEDELNNATIRLSVDQLPDHVTDTFNTDELQIMRSEEGEESYTPIETEYDSDTHELIATVDGFSQHGVGGEDTTPPSIDDTSITPGTELEEEDGPVTVTFEYSPRGTDINLSETDITVDGADSSQIEDKQITDTDAGVTIKNVENGDSLTVDLLVTDEAGNENDESVTIDIEEESSNGNGNNGGSSSSSGSGGGGGGGGGSGAGLPSIDPSDINPPSGADVVMQGEGTIGSGEDESVVAFGNFLETPVTEQARFERSDIDGEARTRDYDGVTDEVESPPGNIVSVSEILIPPEFQDESARLIFNIENAEHSELNSDEIDTNELTVWRHTNGEWEPLETTAIDDSYIEAETPGFSYFAITDSDHLSETESESGEGEPEDVDDSIPGFGVFAAMIAIALFVRLRLRY